MRFSKIFQKWEKMENRNFLKKDLTNKSRCGIINTESEGHEMSKKKDKRDRKMTEEQLQALLHMRTRGYVQKNRKAYNRKAKHKGKESD